MNSLTMARTAAILCMIAALFVAAPATGAAGDDHCRVAATGAQPARRVLKALGIVRGHRLNRGVDSMIDESTAAAMDSKMVLPVELDAASDEAAQIPLGDNEIWPPPAALFPDKLEPGPAPDDLR